MWVNAGDDVMMMMMMVTMIVVMGITCDGYQFSLLTCFEHCCKDVPVIFTLWLLDCVQLMCGLWAASWRRCWATDLCSPASTVSFHVNKPS